MKELKFKGKTFSIIQHNGQPYLTLAEVADALYAKGGTQTATPLNPSTRVRDLYRRHSDEFRHDMTAIVRMQTAGGMQDVRIFSLRGCHLLGMLARTQVAKEFRAWALDMIEVAMSEAKCWQQEYNAAILELSSERAVASMCGKGLNRWKGRKTPLESRVQEIVERAQIAIDF